MGIGGVRERPNRAVSKTVVSQGTVGSNPTPSARHLDRGGFSCGDKKPPRYSCTSSIKVPNALLGLTKATVVPRDPGRGLESMTS